MVYMYIFNNYNKTDNKIRITTINIANCPQYNKYFNCALHINRNVFGPDYI